MFSIYGSTGRLFRGTLEQMRQLPRVHAEERTRAIEPTLHDGSASAPREALEYTPRSPASAGAPVASDAHRSAVAAYEQTRRATAPRPWYDISVQEAMSQPAFTLADDATVYQAWAQMEHHGRGQAPVVNLAGTLVGMVTRASLANLAHWPEPGAEAQDWEQWRSLSIEAVMVTPVPSVSPHADLRRAADALLDSELPGLPVADEHGQVKGFISRADVLRAALQDAGLNVWG